MQYNSKCMTVGAYQRINQKYFYFIILVVCERFRLSTRNSSKSKTFSDSYVIYKHHGKVQYGIIQKIFYVEESRSYLLKIQPLENINYDSLKIGTKVFVNERIIFGTLSDREVHLTSSKNVIEKACFYENNGACYFARYPNFYESS